MNRFATAKEWACTCNRIGAQLWGQRIQSSYRRIRAIEIIREIEIQAIYAHLEPWGA